MTQLIAKV